MSRRKEDVPKETSQVTVNELFEYAFRTRDNNPSLKQMLDDILTRAHTAQDIGDLNETTEDDLACDQAVADLADDIKRVGVSHFAVHLMGALGAIMQNGFTVTTPHDRLNVVVLTRLFDFSVTLCNDIDLLLDKMAKRA